MAQIELRDQNYENLSKIFKNGKKSKFSKFSKNVENFLVCLEEPLCNIFVKCVRKVPLWCASGVEEKYWNVFLDGV
tara:strand:- start:379 stop:606 length:228 start_codon:yes stop_codon:yes gene_type:complete